MASENESEKRETPADIAAEIRAYGDQPPPRHAWGDLADRIEAIDSADAWRSLYSPVGNAAAMRETLVKIRGIAKTFMDATRMRHVTDSVRIDVGNIEDLANAALSAPARNCDLYDSYGDAIRAFEDSENAEDYEEMAEWLYAPAAERKGEGDGK